MQNFYFVVTSPRTWHWIQSFFMGRKVAKLRYLKKTCSGKAELIKMSHKNKKVLEEMASFCYIPHSAKLVKNTSARNRRNNYILSSDLRKNFRWVSALLLHKVKCKTRKDRIFNLHLISIYKFFFLTSPDFENIRWKSSSVTSS